MSTVYNDPDCSDEMMGIGAMFLAAIHNAADQTESLVFAAAVSAALLLRLALADPPLARSLVDGMFAKKSDSDEAARSVREMIDIIRGGTGR